MTEDEWLACDDSVTLLNALPSTKRKLLRFGGSERKLQLFGAGCCRRVERYFRTDAGRRAIDLVERLADGPVPDEEWRAAADGLADGSLRPRHTYLEHTYSSDRRAEAASSAVMFLLYDQPRDMPLTVRAFFSAHTAREVFAVRHGPRRVREEEAAQAALLRDVLGNPFRPAAVDPAWLTSPVVGLAEGIYADRAFDRLPILADALEDAGCDDADFLTHLRGGGPHVRGCWAVDLVLGKQ